MPPALVLGDLDLTEPLKGEILHYHVDDEGDKADSIENYIYYENLYLRNDGIHKAYHILPTPVPIPPKK